MMQFSRISNDGARGAQDADNQPVPPPTSQAPASPLPDVTHPRSSEGTHPTHPALHAFYGSAPSGDPASHVPPLPVPAGTQRNVVQGKRQWTDSPSPPNTAPSERTRENLARRARHGFEHIHGPVVGSSAATSTFDAIFSELQGNSSATMEKLVELIKEGGIGQVICGTHRPAVLLSKEEYSIFDKFHRRGMNVNDNFLLLKAPDDEEESLGYGGMLINKATLAKAIKNNPAIFSGCSSMNGNKSFDEIVQHLNTQQCSENLLEDDRFIGKVLGFRDNADKYAVWSPLFGTGSDAEKEELQKELDNSVSQKTLNEIYQRLPDDHAVLNEVAQILKESPRETSLQEIRKYLDSQPVRDKYAVCAFPSLVAWDSHDTTEMCLDAIQDTIDIHTRQLPQELRASKNDQALAHHVLNEVFDA